MTESKPKITLDEYKEFVHRYIVDEEWPQLRFGQAFWNFYGTGVEGRQNHPELFYERISLVAEQIILRDYVEA
jgi:hypothetical protein